MAQIYTIVGEYDKAIDELEVALSVPSWISAKAIQVDPIFEPLFDLPEFQALMKKYL